VTDQLPDPLTPADCDLRDFAFMPLEVERLRRSRAWLLAKRTPELAFYQINLWTASWHDLPAASLEDDDDVLADLAMCDPKRWKKIKTEALRGWVKCSDGRLYHPVVAEKARESFKGKLEQRWRSECGRIKKHNERHGTKLPRPDFDEWMSLGCPQGQMLPVPRDTDTLSQGQQQLVPGDIGSKREGERKGQGQGEGQGELKKTTSSSSAKLPTCPTAEIIGLYHEILPNLPKAVLPTKDRVKALQKTWHWVLTSLKPDNTRRAENADEALAWFRTYFERATENDFLMGRTPRSGEHANWRCDLDFLLTDRGMKHVIEKTLEPA
jgi:hypothetical protein